MSIQDDYIRHILLSLFIRTNELKLSQLFHILTGKRTASTLYQALDAQILDFFALVDSLSRNEFEGSIKKMEQAGWLKRTKEDTFSITDSGKDELDRYFKKHHYPKHLQALRYMNLSQKVWERLQLITQVFSEKSYSNRQYVPVIKNHANQRWCKQWINRYSVSDEQTAKQLASEWKQVFEQMNQKKADALAMRLTGHHHIGATHTQIAQKLDMSSEEGKLFFLDTLHFIFSLIENRPNEFTLFSSIFNLTDCETFEGLSGSTWTTWKYLEKNYSLEKISRMRKLKIGTVREHIIEIAIVKENFPITQYVPEEKRLILHEKMADNECVSFQEMVQLIPDLSFLIYRLVQIERRR